MRIFIVLATLTFASQAVAVDHMMIQVDTATTETPPPAAGEHPPTSVTEQPAVSIATTESAPLTYDDFRHTLNGYLWYRSDGKSFYEAYRDYVVRAKAPRLTCSTGHCGSASAGPVKPTGGCNCGCSAGSCNCAHSRNVYLAAARNERASQFDVEPLPTGLSTSKVDVPNEKPSISQDVQSMTGLSTKGQSLADCPNCSMQSRPGLFGRLFGPK